MLANMSLWRIITIMYCYELEHSKYKKTVGSIHFSYLAKSLIWVVCKGPRPFGIFCSLAQKGLCGLIKYNGY